jgi:hypothetical protein
MHDGRPLKGAVGAQSCEGLQGRDVVLAGGDAIFGLIVSKLTICSETTLPPAAEHPRPP